MNNFEKIKAMDIDEMAEDKDCTTCKYAYVKDGVYLICDIDGIQNDIVKNCENYEAINER